MGNVVSAEEINGSPIEIVSEITLPDNNAPELVVNETIIIPVVNETIANETINETIITPISNETTNETVASEIINNEAINNETVILDNIISGEFNVTTTKARIVIGRPVKWIKTVKIDSNNVGDVI
ncbi:MAG: hypothetical protein WCP89_02460, partial [archaeon]